MRFWSAKKSAQNRKNRTRKQKRGVRILKKGLPGGMRGAAILGALDGLWGNRRLQV